VVRAGAFSYASDDTIAASGRTPKLVERSVGAPGAERHFFGERRLTRVPAPIYEELVRTTRRFDEYAIRPCGVTALERTQKRVALQFIDDVGEPLDGGVVRWR
jgi:hypothetical protein